MRSSLGLLLVLMVPFAAGCGKSDGEKFADAYCAEVAKCCAQAGISGSGQMCRMLASGGSYNAKAGEACLAEMKAQVSAGTFCSGSASSSPSPCDSVYGSGSTGIKKLGESCDFDDDCAQASEGKVACDFQSNTCKALLETGATCASTFDCVSSAFCDYDTDLCTARVAAGGDCAMSSDCIDGYYCASSSSQCTAQKDNGAACTSLSECRSGNCQDGTCQDSGFENSLLAMLCA